MRDTNATVHQKRILKQYARYKRNNPSKENPKTVREILT